MTPVQKSPADSAATGPPGSRAAPFPAWPGVAGLVAAALLFGLGLGRLDLWAPDEPRYGAIAEELRSFRHGGAGLVLLHLNDVPYTQKPPLYFWLAALAGAPAGHVSEWAARAPSAAAGLVCVVLTALVGRRLLASPGAALLAAGFLATSARFVFTARRAQLDVLLTAFELLAIYCFLRIEDAGGLRARRPEPVSTGALAALHASLGAAALVKGPVGWLPLAVFAGTLAWQGRLGAFRRLVPAWALALSLGPVALWIASAIWLAPPGFAEAAVTDNLLGRFLHGTAHARPLLYYGWQLPLDFLPWSLLLPLGGLRLWRRLRPAHGPEPPPSGPSADRARARFLTAWIAIPLVFFSLSAGKRGLYLLPIFPALALVAALGATRLRQTGPGGPRTSRAAVLALAAVAAIELAGLGLVLPRFEAIKSPRPIARAAAKLARPDEAIGVYGLRPIEGAIPYYGGRAVTSLDSEASLRRFLAGGGRHVLMRARHWQQLGPGHDLVPVQAFRSGRRTLALATRRTPYPEGGPIDRGPETGIVAP